MVAILTQDQSQSHRPSPFQEEKGSGDMPNIDLAVPVMLMHHLTSSVLNICQIFEEFKVQEYRIRERHPSRHQFSFQTLYRHSKQAFPARVQVLRLFWWIIMPFIHVVLEEYTPQQPLPAPARKVGVVSIFKMADLEQTLFNLSSSKMMIE